MKELSTRLDSGTSDTCHSFNKQELKMPELLYILTDTSSVCLVDWPGSKEPSTHHEGLPKML